MIRKEMNRKDTVQVGFGRMDISPTFGVPLAGYGYIPNAQAHEYGCYESHTTNFVPETGDELATTLVTMLESLQ